MTRITIIFSSTTIDVVKYLLMHHPYELSDLQISLEYGAFGEVRVEANVAGTRQEIVEWVNSFQGVRYKITNDASSSLQA